MYIYSKDLGIPPVRALARDLVLEGANSSKSGDWLQASGESAANGCAEEYENRRVENIVAPTGT